MHTSPTRVSTRITSAALGALLAVAVLGVAPAMAQGGTYTSDLSGVSFYLPDPWTPITHGIPHAEGQATGDEGDAYLHHALVNYPEGVAGALPDETGELYLELGVTPTSFLCLDDGASPDELIAALIGYNARAFPDRPFPPVAPASSLRLDGGTVAGRVTLAMSGVAAEWYAWPITEGVTAWQFAGGIGDLAEHRDITDRIAASIAYSGSAADLEALDAPWSLGDPCSPIPSAPVADVTR